MSKEEGNFFKFVAGVFSGLVSGVVLGLLFAPKPGKEIREDLTNKSRELKDYTMNKFAEFQQISRGKAVEMTGTIQTKASKISSKLDELARHGTDILIQDEVQ